MSLPTYSRSPEESGPVYNVEQSEEGHQANEPSGKKLDKELKPRSVKGDLAKPLSQYDLNSYPSEYARHQLHSNTYLSQLSIAQMKS